MEKGNALTSIKEIIQKSVALLKCKKCGCLRESLDGAKAALLASYRDDFSELLTEVEAAINKIEPSEYT